MRVGGARISEVHANFIVTGPDARAADVWSLIRNAHDLVLREWGIDLEPEVKFLGSFDEGQG